ncbi:hypothetical protein OAA99_01705 [Omnitrophica bacterium]|nr:hypothetical protein [Candidatus Omnitrophota bacterium]
MCVACAYSGRARLYRRIPQYFVADVVYGFIQDNRLSNCFEFLENDNQLLLKCWRDDKLVDAEINIIDRNRKNVPYYPALSVVI